MQKKWTQMNVDLGVLSSHVEDFFKDKGLLTRKEQSNREYTVFWAPKRGGINTSKVPKVRISGDPNDFTVEVVASELTNRQIRLGLLTKPVGGGYFLLKGLRLREALEKIESDFWAYLEPEITRLTNSAKS